jgi:hypothetical protein
MKTSPYDTITQIAEKLDISEEDRDNLKRIAQRCGSQLKEVENLKDSIIYSGVTDYKKSVIQKKIDKIRNLL